jgi:hypothetical protein
MTRELKPCGTPAAFMRHRRAGEEPCHPCREAMNQAARESKARRRAYDQARRQATTWKAAA